MFGTKKIRVGINGFGRIGRAMFRLSLADKNVEIVAINDLGDVSNFAYLLKYDSVYRTLGAEVSSEPGALVVDGRKISFISEKDPTKLPWKDMNIDVVVESTGIFDDYAKAGAHIIAGAKHVVISAPVKEDSADGATILMGVNEQKFGSVHITSNASCTTNASSPLIAILDEKIGIEIHGRRCAPGAIYADGNRRARYPRRPGKRLVFRGKIGYCCNLAYSGQSFQVAEHERL